MLQISVCYDLTRVWRVKARVCQLFEVCQHEFAVWRPLNTFNCFGWGKAKNLGASLLESSLAQRVINPYCDVKPSLCSFSRNEQAVRFSWEEKRFVISMKLVISLIAVSLFFLLSDITQTSKQQGRKSVARVYLTSFPFPFFSHH